MSLLTTFLFFSLEVTYSCTAEVVKLTCLHVIFYAQSAGLSKDSQSNALCRSYRTLMILFQSALQKTHSICIPKLFSATAKLCFSLAKPPNRNCGSALGLVSTYLETCALWQKDNAYWITSYYWKIFKSNPSMKAIKPFLTQIKLNTVYLQLLSDMLKHQAI